MTGLRVVVLDDTLDVARELAPWERLGSDATVDFVHEHLTGAALVDRLAGAEVVVAMRERTPIDAELIARLVDLRLIVTTGMRNASIDVEAATRRGVTVCGTGAGQTATVELTWALILGLVRQVARNDAVVRGGGWQTRLGEDLAGRTLGLVGLGRLGTRMAGVGQAFGMDVRAWSPHLTAERAAAAGVEAVDKDTLFRSCDVVSIHLVLAEATRGVVGAVELDAMPSHAYLVNCSRADLVDQDALRRVVHDRRIAGVGLDVFPEEPISADSWVRTADRVLLSPHLGYVTRENYRTMYTDAVADIRAWSSGSPVRVLDRPPDGA